MLDLIYPPLCSSCGLQRPLDNHIFCLDCLHELPETGFHLHPSNPFAGHFKGRIDLKAGAAFYIFREEEVHKDCCIRSNTIISQILLSP